MGSTACQDILEKRKTSWPRWDSKYGLPSLQPTIRAMLSWLPTGSCQHNGFFNTLLSDDLERRDCSPMRCWQSGHVTSFYIFLHNIIHMHLSAGTTHLLLQGYQQLGAGCLGLTLQTNTPVLTPIFRTLRLQQSDHSFRYFLFSFSCNHGLV
jgi:hypothetical protein